MADWTEVKEVVAIKFQVWCPRCGMVQLHDFRSVAVDAAADHDAWHEKEDQA